MKKRLTEFLAHLGIGQLKFEKKVGITRGHVNKISDNVTLKVLNKIEAAYPELNMEWLKTGKGEMLNKSAAVESGQKEATEQTVAGLPLIPFEFMAGFGEDNAGISLNECERYSIPEFENIGAEFLVRVGGSSMYPKYSSGDILACKKIPNEDITFFQWGKVYVIDSAQGQLIKRVFEHEDGERIILVSDNTEKYKPFPIQKSDIRSLSIVLGVLRME